MPIRLNMPASQITWGGGEGVTLETSAGTLKARTVIVTVSVGVLAAEPLANQVFFAGEATSAIQHSSIHGAFLSGRDAVKLVLKAS